ncbi:hypothetical protein ACFPYI_06065 [Halomarina salina]|uniref:DUF8142 domain-containing protein n=1 Tax=Halomarina salina TaxID=1872699 RepID=A0ABD5RL16_9EURY|nr:hypothetical protein [Halomarina salina]
MATEFTVSRKLASLYIAPFVLLGLADIALLLFWGLDPLWGFMILPPILFISVIGWIAIRTGFARDRVDDEEETGVDEELA